MALRLALWAFLGSLVGIGLGMLSGCSGEELSAPSQDATTVPDALPIRYVKTCQEAAPPWDGWSYSVCDERAADGETCFQARYYLGTIAECWWGPWGLKEPETGYAVKECGDCAGIGGRLD